MKRRDFLASAAVLSLFSRETWATTKKKKTGKVLASKAKKAHGKTSTAKHGHKITRHHHEKAPTPSAPIVHTAEDPIIENPPRGTSASRLPAAKAPEPPTEWRTFEITTTVNLKDSGGPTHLWLPLPLNQDTLFQRSLGHDWEGNHTRAGMRRFPDGELEVFECEWTDGRSGQLQIKSLVSTADRQFDITKRTIPPEREDILRRNLEATRLLPNDGLAFQLGSRIVGRIKDPVAQAKAIYDWVVDQTIYDPSLPACGTGNVRQQLLSGRYGGRSADINGLFVSICRAIGIPARQVYGLRIASSRLFRSLGLTDSDATHGHHVRAEFYVPGYGWIPVDPSDVRRAVAIEGLTDADSRLSALKKVLFGIWEMNWVALNVGTDVILPGRNTAQPFLLLPELESGNEMRDGGDPTRIAYKIDSRQVLTG